MEVDSEALPTIAESRSTLRLEGRGYVPLPVLPNGRTVTGRDSAGACLYLDNQGWCELHAELGSQRKPLACQLYPYSITATPDGHYASLSFACPVVLWGGEGDLDGNRRELEALLQSRGSADGPLPHLVEIVSGRKVDWNSYRELESRLQELNLAQMPALRLLGAAGEVLRVLAGTELDSVPDWQSLEDPPSGDDFEEMVLTMICASLIALLELPTEPESRHEMSQAVQSGQAVLGPRHQITLPPFSLQEEPDGLLQDCLERYYRNALFGKTLLSDTVVSRLLLLSAGYALVVAYSQAFEAVTESRKEAIARAFELVEAELLTHSHSVSPIFISLEETLCQAYGVAKAES